jgi:hypothetical protein
MLHLLDYIPQRRIGVFDHLRPQRWNWYLIRRPIERSLDQQAPQPLTIRQVRNLRHFWLDGIFAAASESFYLAFIPLFALAYGATNQQVGWITAIGNLAGAAALFPGARLIETIGHRKETVVWSGGGMARLMVLLLALLPLLTLPPPIAVLAIAALNGARSFSANFANPAWTALVAEIVPGFMRGRYFSMRNLTMGLATSGRRAPSWATSSAFWSLLQSGWPAPTSFPSCANPMPPGRRKSNVPRAACAMRSGAGQGFGALWSAALSGIFLSKSPPPSSTSTWSPIWEPRPTPWASLPASPVSPQ